MVASVCLKVSGDVHLKGEATFTQGLIHVRTLALLKALDVSSVADGDVVYMAGRDSVGDGGQGLFAWDASDLSAKVGGDSESGIYVSPDSDATGASGAWVRQYSGEVNVRWFGATGDGSTDDTAAFEGALRHGQSVFIPAPETAYLVSECDVEPGQIVRGENTDTTAILRVPEARWVFRTTNTPGSPSTSSVHHVRFQGFSIDSDLSTAGVGVLLEASWYGVVDQVRVENIGSGSWDYDDGSGHGVVTRLSAGIMAKGIAGVSGAYYNSYYNATVAGRAADTFGSNGFVWTSTTDTSPQKANFNTAYSCRAFWCFRNFRVGNGNDLVLFSPEASAGTTGVYLNSDRTLIFKPYLEQLDNAFVVSANASRCEAYGECSVSGTTKLVVGASQHLRWLLQTTVKNYSTSNVATSRSLDANSVTLGELADVVGTLIKDMQARGEIH